MNNLDNYMLEEKNKVCETLCNYFHDGECHFDGYSPACPPLCEILDWEDLEEMAKETRKYNNDNYIWQNKYTGEIFTSLFKAVITAFMDFKHYPTCRTLQVFNIGRTEE